MKFSLTDEIPHPRPLVFATHRDKLVDLVEYLPNVDKVVVESRKVEGPVVHLLNRWHVASSDVPGPVRPFLKPDHLQYLDKAKWDESTWRCEWEITLPSLPDAITARGTSTFLAEGDETVFQLHGEFLIHPDRIPGVPTFVARTAAPSIEKFVVGLLQPNLKKSSQAVRQYIDDHP